MTFDSVVGQRHISDTLKNAIKSGHLAQAFLFSGPRGVGKTTCARILAKTINCFDRTENIEACEKCESCQSFNEGHSLNVYELDAASNNSVDDIRTLIDQVRFAPQLGSKKVYIIDEVHMLSSQAFNAFLKTLEEPPSHAIFILATTEKHKIIPTILSRCQIFDFNRIDLNDMVRKLDEIAKKEGVTAEHDALHLISQKSDGSLRDALSMFDQMVTYAGNNLSYNSVVENLSILSTDYYFDLTEYLVKNDIASSLNLFNEILQKGFDGHHFLLGLAEHLRNLLVAQDHSTIELLSAGPQIKEKYAAQTINVSSAFIIKALNIISKADLNYKSTKNQRLLVELCLINLAELSSSNSDKQKIVNPFSSAESIKKKQPEIKNDPVPDALVEFNIAKKSEQQVVKVSEVEASPESMNNKADHSKPESETIMELAEIKKSTDSTKKMLVEYSPETEVLTDGVKPKSTITGESKLKRRYDLSALTGSTGIRSVIEANEIKSESYEGNEGDNVIRFTDKIDEEKLQKIWGDILKNYDERNEINLFTSLSKYPVELVEGHFLKIVYDNKSQAESISKEKSAILGKMRTVLRNDTLQIKLVISEMKLQKAYTQSEKLEKLIEKNPAISLLKVKLDLEPN